MNRDVNKDISKYDFDNLYIVANLPYYITTPIITKIINDKIPTNEIVIMIQKKKSLIDFLLNQEVKNMDRLLYF